MELLGTSRVYAFEPRDEHISAVLVATRLNAHLSTVCIMIKESNFPL
jgi:hypothetical protein